VQPGEDGNAPPGTEWTTRAGRVYRSVPSEPVPRALEPELAGIPALLAERRLVAGNEVRWLNSRIYAAYSRRLAARLDEAFDPADAPDDTDETIERAPATIDDDPAPAHPERPLETWNASWEDVTREAGVHLPGWDETWEDEVCALASDEDARDGSGANAWPVSDDAPGIRARDRLLRLLSA
jgi:hypothetical protein